MKGMAYNGWKVGLPDKFWPVTLDNFFENPDEIRELGLCMMESVEVVKSSDQGGRWPGCRSESLWETDERLAQRITEKILSCYFNLDLEQLFWSHCDLQFQLIPSIDKDKNNIKNRGWIHRDVPLQKLKRKLNYQSEPKNCHELAGLIYLTPDIEPGTGTSLFNMKKDKTLNDWKETIDVRIPVFKGDPISDEEVKKAWERHKSCFIEKVRFENIYNRLIMYDTEEFHAANSYYTAKDSRLTLGFFIGGILADKWPLERVRQEKS
jgi:hypothetical protein